MPKFLKTFFILFSKGNFIGPLTPLMIGTHAVERVYQTKFLGIILDCKLSWEMHIDYLCSRLSKVSGIMYLTRTCLTREAMLSIYYSLFYSLLIYGINIWGGACLQYVNKLYLIQKRFLRTITYTNRSERMTPIFNSLKILKLHTVRKLF